MFVTIRGGKRCPSPACPPSRLARRAIDRSCCGPLKKNELPQIVEKTPHVRTWAVGASMPSHMLAAYSEIPRLVSSLQKLVPDAQVTFTAECVSNIDVDIRDGISRALNVKLIEMCPRSVPSGVPTCAGYHGNSQQSATIMLRAQKKSILWFFSRVKKGNEPQLG